jgi:hypothetical protein
VPHLHNACMRLDAHSVELIHQTVSAHLGPGAQARLFGSRLNDEAKGGDVDLHILLPEDVDSPVWVASMLAAKLERQLGGRKVDVRLLTPSMTRHPVDTVALSEGVVLWH